MPLRTSRASTPTKGTLVNFTPANDAATHRDLLMFEERLKANAAMLKRRRSRYQGFLVIVVLFLCISSIDVVFTTRVLITPINFVLTHVKPPYGPFQPLEPHQYFAPGVCLTAGTTLFLFFAGGFWAEKIGYVSHANKTLRSFNMYLNVRPRPMSSMWIMRVLRSSHRNEGIVSPPLTPITTAFSRRRTRDNFSSYSAPSTPSPIGPEKQDLGNLNLTDADSVVTRAQPTPVTTRPQRTGGGGIGAQITPIPPPTNPRGELIFNSRVDKTFRESYERYRTAYERAKEEWDRKVYEERAKKAWWSWFLMRRIGQSNNVVPTTPTTSRSPSGPAGGGKASEGTITLSPLSVTAQPRRARTASRGSTPTSSRKPSPAGSMGSASARSKRHSALVDALESVPERLPLDGDSLLMRRTPTPRTLMDEESDTSSVITLQDTPTQSSSSSSSYLHKRKESFSFLLGRPGGLTDE
ncbi:hypothetical protein FRB96_008771 [Tulasnella sp. 330]|nr:hypothetical protein FRB96_008771 [Tulasnella sp. 330]KAG8884127.1 hypothetical protein FRB97_005110 [Tulasnella sp. 331]KAG8890199.1 hypothetical protein FRB98_000527 [Tulasnella sp. 332]